MTKFNIEIKDIESGYLSGLLPQRNDKKYFYEDSSCRSNVSNFILSSENRRILNKTNHFTYEKILLKEFNYNTNIQKQCYKWTRDAGWDFPASSIKTVFTDHIFNYLYIWKDENNNTVGYSVVYEDKNISHIAYVFYDPTLANKNLPIRMVLQVIIDSNDKNIQFCYLGRFSKDNGHYKRNMPGFEFFNNNIWTKYI